MWKPEVGSEVEVEEGEQSRHLMSLALDRQIQSLKP